MNLCTLKVLLACLQRQFLQQKKVTFKAVFLKEERPLTNPSAVVVFHIQIRFLHEPNSHVSSPDDSTWLWANLKYLLLCSWSAGLNPNCYVEVILLIFMPKRPFVFDNITGIIPWTGCVCSSCKGCCVGCKVFTWDYRK